MWLIPITTCVRGGSGLICRQEPSFVIQPLHAIVADVSAEIWTSIGLLVSSAVATIGLAYWKVRHSPKAETAEDSMIRRVDAQRRSLDELAQRTDSTRDAIRDIEALTAAARAAIREIEVRVAATRATTETDERDVFLAAASRIEALRGAGFETQRAALQALSPEELEKVTNVLRILADTTVTPERRKARA